MQEIQEVIETTPKAKQSIVETLEQGRILVPQVIRLVTAILQESLAEVVGPLLMIGLILSMSNFLLDGAIFRFSVIPFIWVLCQSVAVDANMGVMLLRSVRNFHAGEIVKGILFLLIALALLFVAAIISDVEAVQEIVNRDLTAIFGQIHISIETLTFIRSSAIVMLVAATPLESVSLRRAEKKAKIEAMKAEDPTPPTPPEEPETGPIINVFEVMSLVNTMQDLVDEVKLLRAGTIRELPGTTQEHEVVKIDETQPEPVGTTQEQEARLQEAYTQLKTQGEAMSVNQLQRTARVRRETASAWLKQKTEEVSA